MTEDKQVDKVINLISEMIIKYITDNENDKKECKIEEKKVA